LAEDLLREHAGIPIGTQPFQKALGIAVHNQYWELVKSLVYNSADVDAPGGHLGNGLQAASWRGNRQMVELLLDKGANVNLQGGHYGNTLQAAAWEDHALIIKLLVDSGAGVNAQGGHYSTALRAASFGNHGIR
jgi:ankyrin repeat protein